MSNVYDKIGVSNRTEATSYALREWLPALVGAGPGGCTCLVDYARVIEELPQAVGRYQFSHALIQETLSKELTLTRRVRLHARIAETLDRTSRRLG